MNINCSWLKEYIDFDLSSEELSNKLTLAGLEVENLIVKGKSDALLEINITPNRPDCLSFIGIAREVSALTGSPVKYPDSMVQEEGKNIEMVTAVAIHDEYLCPRYSARVIQGVKVGPSPQWLVDKLNSINIRSINNIVDITNFVLHEVGHPLHAFDYDLLKENRIVVRRGNKGEKFVTLDNTTCDIKDSMLVIADAERPIALAGIIGGKNTEVSEKTTNILLESAYFEPTQIRRTSKNFGLQTESSFRFERGTDPENVLKASNRAAGLILSVAGGKVAKGIIDIYPTLISSPEIILRLDSVNKILGTRFSGNEVKGYVEKLGFSVLKDQKGHFKIKVPSWRRDITREIDLIEEITRVHGYDNIEAKSPECRINKVNLNKYYAFEKEAKNYFKGKGFCEAINYAFISDEMQRLFQNNNRNFESNNVFLKNPLNNEWRVMRKSLLPGLLISIQKNISRGIEDVQLFELGRRYDPETGINVSSNNKTANKNKSSLSKEVNYLSGIVTSKVERELWKEEISREIYYLKGLIEMFLEGMHLKKFNFKKTPLPAFNSLMELYSGENKIGFIGELRRGVNDKFNIKDKLFVFEINLDMLYKIREKITSFRSISKYPNILRDIAILVDRKVESKVIEDFVMKQGTFLLKKLTLFDCYEGKSIPPGKKSLAYSLVFADDERTLQDEEVDTIHENIINGLADKFKAYLRPQ